MSMLVPELSAACAAAVATPRMLPFLLTLEVILLLLPWPEHHWRRREQKRRSSGTRQHGSLMHSQGQSNSNMTPAGALGKNDAAEHEKEPFALPLAEHQFEETDDRSSRHGVKTCTTALPCRSIFFFYASCYHVCTRAGPVIVSRKNCYKNASRREDLKPPCRWPVAMGGPTSR